MASDNLQANWDLCHIHEKGESSSAAVLRARCRYSATTTTLATVNLLAVCWGWWWARLG